MTRGVSGGPGLRVEVADGLAGGGRAALNRAFEVLREHLATGFPPGLAGAVCSRDGLLGRAFGGWAHLPPQARPVTPQTRFDLASLTKVMVTAPLCAHLEQAGRWSFDDPVGRWVPGFRHPAITLRHCLTHTSGLPAHRPFWTLAGSPAGMRSALLEVDPEAGAGQAVIYSDLNFMLLGWAVEACAGGPLDALGRELVLAPLGMDGSGFRPAPADRPKIAATEVWGEVHDENARGLGGVSGHAGLFAPLDDVVRFATALVAPGRDPRRAPYLPVDPAAAPAGAPPEVRGIGWRLQPMPIAPGWPDDAYGHTGFTGTSLLVAPAAGLAVVLLTNAVHPQRREGGAGAIRAAFHGALLPLLA